MNRGIGTCGKVESGLIRPTADYLLELARLLRFKDSEYVLAHLEIFGTEPALPLDPDAGLTVHDSWQRALDGQSEMAYVSDRRYDLRLWNVQFTRMFPTGRPPQNTLQWMILSDEARDLCLPEWDTAWAPFVVPQFRAAYAAHPDDPVLNGIREGILEDRRARHFYDRGVDAEPELHLHPDGDRRPLLHATRGLGWATMIAGQPLSSPGSRHMIILFDEE